MAQHQDLKRKGGADPDHQMSRNHAPPPLSIEVPKMSDLPNTSKFKPWIDVVLNLPVDILLLTAEDCEFLACYTFLENSFKSFEPTLGYVYFGTMGEYGEEALKVALMRYYKGSPGSVIVIENAVMKLIPKAAFFVGECMGLNPIDTKLGDVVISSKVSTEQFTTSLRVNMRKRILYLTQNWNPPLKDPVGEETVQVHRESDIFIGSSQFITKQRRRMPQSRVIAVEREGEGNITIINDILM